MTDLRLILIALRNDAILLEKIDVTPYETAIKAWAIKRVPEELSYIGLDTIKDEGLMMERKRYLNGFNQAIEQMKKNIEDSK